MQKLIETLKSFGVEIPADKQGDIKKALSEHYKNVAEHNKVLSKLETDRDSWKTRAENAEDTLKSFEGIDPAKIQQEIEGWKQKAKEAEENAQKQIYDRDFNDALKEEIGNYKFSSEFAKKAVMAKIKEAGLKLKNGKILGLSDLIEQIKKDDASAFVDENQQKLEQNRARFTQQSNQGNSSGATLTMKDIFAIKDATERQKAIDENKHLFSKSE